MRALLSFLVLILFFILPACHTTSVSYSGLRPAEITLPKEIKSVVLVNRYKAERRNSWMNIVEGIFTGEILFADRRGVDQAMSGLQQRLQSGPRYRVVMANEQLAGNGTGMLPPPLAQTQVINLCNVHQSDALVAIEAFDSDIAIRTEPRTRKRTVEGKEVIENYVEAFEAVRITIGWRVYSGVNGSVIDQHQMQTVRTFSATGPNEIAARSALLFPLDAIMQTGFTGGDAYGLRIAPSWVNYTRLLYSKASRSAKMKAATKMARRGDWEEAAKIWETMTKSPNTKVAKRALYNRAVAAEMVGDFETALQYARRASDEYNLRQADRYIYTLRARLAELQRLDQQMEE